MPNSGVCFLTLASYYYRNKLVHLVLIRNYQKALLGEFFCSQPNFIKTSHAEFVAEETFCLLTAYILTVMHNFYCQRISEEFNCTDLVRRQDRSKRCDIYERDTSYITRIGFRPICLPEPSSGESGETLVRIC